MNDSDLTDIEVLMSELKGCGHPGVVQAVSRAKVRIERKEKAFNETLEAAEDVAHAAKYHF